MYRNSLKINQRPTCKTGNYNTLGRNIKINLHNLGFGKSSLDMTPKT